MLSVLPSVHIGYVIIVRRELLVYSTPGIVLSRLNPGVEPLSSNISNGTDMLTFNKYDYELNGTTKCIAVHDNHVV